ncbi:MAG: hypothetical protein JO322_08705 [Candidatus Eremiobacteraeota bacterium]|nr:hypothetical protein [Candidatus Eremiobacteraeota bacterium]
MRDRVNAIVHSETIRDRMDSPNFFERNACAKGLPLDTPILKMLEDDDRAT